jgi:hypothetical protein
MYERSRCWRNSKWEMEHSTLRRADGTIKYLQDKEVIPDLATGSEAPIQWSHFVYVECAAPNQKPGMSCAGEKTMLQYFSQSGQK